MVRAAMHEFQANSPEIAEHVLLTTQGRCLAIVAFTGHLSNVGLATLPTQRPALPPGVATTILVPQVGAEAP